jgi:hypothetical protein
LALQRARALRCNAIPIGLIELAENDRATFAQLVDHECIVRRLRSSHGFEAARRWHIESIEDILR